MNMLWGGFASKGMGVRLLALGTILGHGIFVASSVWLSILLTATKDEWYAT